MLLRRETCLKSNLSASSKEADRLAWRLLCAATQWMGKTGKVFGCYIVIKVRAALLAIQQSVVTNPLFTVSYTAVCSDGPMLHCYAIQLPANCSANPNDSVPITVTQSHSNVWSVLFPRRDVNRHIPDDQFTNKTAWRQKARLLRLVVERSAIAHTGK